MDSLNLWCRKYSTWLLREPGAVWTTALGILVTVVPLWWFRGEPAFRIAGMVDQLFGLGTVAVGIGKTRRLFGRPSFLARLAGWWHRRPRRRQTVSGGLNSMQGASTLIGAGEVWSPTSPRDYIEVRVTALEKNLIEVRDRVRTLAQDTREELGRNSDKIEREREERSAADRAISLRLEEAGAGGLDISLMGVVWLSFGFIMSSLAPELAKLVSR